MTIKQFTGALFLPLLAVGSMAAAPDLRLVEAVKKQDSHTARILLEEGVNVNAPQGDGATALHWAAHWDDVETAEWLVRAGAHVNTADEHGITPLWLASTNGSVAMVEMLLKAGANPNSPLPTGETPLMRAARTGNVGAVHTLLASGADVNAKAGNTHGQTALMWAVAERNDRVARVLVEHGADVRARSTAGFTPLLFAAREGDLGSARMLLAAGADVNEAAADGSTALLAATVRGHTELAEVLLERGADPNANGAGYAPLHWAAGTWETAVSGVFGITRQSREWHSLSGLHGEAKAGFVKTLLAYGANPNERITKNPARFGFTLFNLELVGATPFFLAAMAGDVTVMRLLERAGADPSLATEENTTPLMVAAGIGRIVGESRITERDALEAAKLAVELGADVNATNKSGETALHGVALWGADTIVQFLADSHALLNVKNERGETPLMIAEGKGARVTAMNIFHKSTADLLRRLSGENRRIPVGRARPR